MKAAGVRLTAGAFVLVLGAAVFVPLASAAGQTRADPTVEGWYQPNPSCAAPGGCLTADGAPAPVSPFPPGTLHVALSAGRETARSYVAFSLSTIDNVTAAVLTVPLDMAATHGSSSPEAAKIQVCTFVGELAAGGGSIDEPPATDCNRAVPAVDGATPQPHVQADVTRLLTSAGTLGVALLPDPSKAAPTDSWRLVFSAHTRADAAKTAPASLTLAIGAASDDGDSTAPATFPPVKDVAPPGATSFAAVRRNATTVTVAVARPSGSPSIPAAVAQAPPQAPAPTETVSTVVVPYAWPAVWLLPLALLVLVPATAVALTKDLAPVRPRE